LVLRGIDVRLATDGPYPLRIAPGRIAQSLIKKADQAMYQAKITGHQSGN
jgi:hypothetical protein